MNFNIRDKVRCIYVTDDESNCFTKNNIYIIIEVERDFISMICDRNTKHKHSLSSPYIIFEKINLTQSQRLNLNKEK